LQLFDHAQLHTRHTAVRYQLGCVESIFAQKCSH